MLLKLAGVSQPLSEFGIFTGVFLTYHAFHSSFSLKGEPDFGIFIGGTQNSGEQVSKGGEPT